MVEWTVEVGYPSLEDFIMNIITWLHMNLFEITLIFEIVTFIPGFLILTGIQYLIFYLFFLAL